MSRISKRTPREGLLSEETLEQVKHADKLLLEAFHALEDAALMVSEDVAGGRAGDVSDETMEACKVHPLYKRLWDAVGAIEDHGAAVLDCVKLEETR